MARQKKVLDASIITKWFVSEAGSEAALALREEHRNGKSLLIVPELAFLEVANSLRFKSKEHIFLTESIQDLWKTQFYIERLNPDLLIQAVQLSLKHNLTVYDAVYLSVSINHGCPLITADKDLGKIKSTVLL